MKKNKESLQKIKQISIRALKTGALSSRATDEEVDSAMEDAAAEVARINAEELPRQVPRIVELLAKVFPLRLLVSVIFSMFPNLCMRGTRVRFVGLDGDVRTCCTQTICVGKSGTGKKYINLLNSLLIGQIIKDDKLERDRLNKWLSMPEKERSKQYEPEVELRFMAKPPSSAECINVMAAAKGKHVIISSGELNVLVNGLNTAHSKEVTEYLKLSMDGEGEWISRTMATGKNVATKCRLALSMAGTFKPAMTLCKKHIESGVANRILFTIVPPREKEKPQYGMLSEEEEAELEMLLSRLDKEDNTVEQSYEMSDMTYHRLLREKALRIPELEELCLRFETELWETTDAELMDKRIRELSQRTPDIMHAVGTLLYVLDGKKVTQEMLDMVEWIGRTSVRNSFLLNAHLLDETQEYDRIVQKNAREYDTGAGEKALMELQGREFGSTDVMGLKAYSKVSMSTVYVYLRRWLKSGFIVQCGRGRYMIAEGASARFLPGREK